MDTPKIVFPDGTVAAVALFEAPDGTVGIDTIGSNEKVARLLLEALIANYTNSLLLGVAGMLGMAPTEAQN